MKCFITYNEDTGEILQSGCCPSSAVQAQAQPGIGVMVVESGVDVLNNKVVNGELHKREIPYASIVDVTRSINTDDLDATIGRMLQTEDTALIEQWKLDNYALLRFHEYPQYTEYVDSLVKCSSTNPEIQQAGQQQLDSYYKNCLAVKQRFPKN